MSDHSRSNRRISPRILPISKVEPSRHEVQRPAAQHVQPSAQPPRARAYGAPLATQVRTVRTVTDDTESVGANYLETTETIVEKDWLAGTDTEQRSGQDDANENLSKEWKAELAWEQLPQITSNTGGVTAGHPVESIADEKQFTALGSYLAVMIDGFTAFCNTPSVTESGIWRARLPMPQEILPETTLEVNISESHAKLRFESQDALSKDLISQHIERLQLQVKKALDPKWEIEVSVW